MLYNIIHVKYTAIEDRESWPHWWLTCLKLCVRAPGRGSFSPVATFKLCSCKELVHAKYVIAP